MHKREEINSFPTIGIMNTIEGVSTKDDDVSSKNQSDHISHQATTYHVTQPQQPIEETDDDHVKRPMNAFMVWSRTERRKLALKYPNMLNCEISKLLGAEWSRMGDEDKQPYIQESKRLRTIHSQKYPDYSYKPRRRKRKASQNHPMYPSINFPQNGPVIPPPYQFSAAYPKMAADAFRMTGFGAEAPSYHSTMQDPSKNAYFNAPSLGGGQDMKYCNIPGSSIFSPTTNFGGMTMGTSVSAPSHMYSSSAGQYAPPLFKDHSNI